MPKLLIIPRINRRLFQMVSGILWLLFLIVFFTIFRAYAPSLDANLPAIMKFVMNIVDLQYYLLAFAIFLMLGFTYAYIGRFKDAGISPLIALIPLLLFYGLIILFMIDLIALLKESNLLLFIAKLKKFTEAPTVESFQRLFSPEWIRFIAEKKRWIDVGVIFYVMIVMSAMFVPSQARDNRYGNQCTLSVAIQLLSVIMAILFWMMTILVIYLGWQLIQFPNPAEYLLEYDRFMHLLNSVRGI